MIFGKYIIESLTTGMYTDPFVVFREYIQNAADSIDEAVRTGILLREAAYIKINIDPIRQCISIEDNGVGLSERTAYRTLSDIGNSKKIQGKTRGFRGIGRFSGLSYCDKLIFSTSTVQENYSYGITFDARKLRHLIVADSTTITANDTMKRIITERRSTISKDSHYFRVTMENVHVDTGLLDIDKVYTYLRQTAPVAFDRLFSWGQSIIDTIVKQLGQIETYHIILETKNRKIDVTKPYFDTFLLNRQTGATDQITSITYCPIKGFNGTTVGYAWYGRSSFQGTIIGKEIKGLRIRVGNILIGDHTSLNHIFKDPRFNGWVIGEVYIQDSNLIPNARRDDFERNDSYYLLAEQLINLAADIVKVIRNASTERNKTLSRSVAEVDTIITKADEIILGNERISPSMKRSISAKISKAKQQLNTEEYTGVDEESRRAAIEKLDILIGRVQGAASFRSLNLIPDITNSDKKLLERVFDRLLDQYPADEAKRCIDMVLSIFTPQSND